MTLVDAVNATRKTITSGLGSERVTLKVTVDLSI